MGMIGLRYVTVVTNLSKTQKFILYKEESEHA